jgi:hypothetical protein
MSVDRDPASQTPTVRLRPTEGRIDIDNAALDNIDNRVTLHLNAAPAWTVSIALGAGTGDFDFSAYAVPNLTLNAGVADVDLKLGDKAPQASVSIDAGVASVVVRVPKAVGCRLVSKGALTDNQLDDFVKDGNAFLSPGYANTAKKIDITCNGGLSRFKIVRY